MNFRSSIIGFISCLFVFVLIVPAWFAQSAEAQQRRWYPRVIARGTDRDVIKSTPIHHRPNRPLHFYGNTVRRNYHRGNTVPLQRSLERSSTPNARRR